MPTIALYRDDFYLSTAEAVVTAVHEDGAVELDQTCFYAASGGQPGDTGFFEREDGSRIQLVRDPSRRHQGHHPASPCRQTERPCPPSAKRSCCMSIGRAVTSSCACTRPATCSRSSVPFRSPGRPSAKTKAGSISTCRETIDKDQVTADLMKLVGENHPDHPPVDHRRRNLPPIPASSSRRMSDHPSVSAACSLVCNRRELRR